MEERKWESTILTTREMKQSRHGVQVNFKLCLGCWDTSKHDGPRLRGCKKN